MSMYSNAKYIYSYFIKRNWTPQAICGMLGNLESESSLEPNIWESGVGPGYGLSQWTPASKLINWCNARGLNYKSLEGQCARLQYEMENSIQFFPSYSYSMTSQEYMHSHDSAYTLGLVFLANYERPYNPKQPQRGSQASYWYNQFKNSHDNNGSDNSNNVKSSTYTVKLGDTLSSISERFGLTIDQIMKINNISNPNIISVGETLILKTQNTRKSTDAFLEYRLNNLPTPKDIFGNVALQDPDNLRVAQKTYVGPSNIYAVQYFGHKNTVVITRAPKPNDGYDVDFEHGKDKMILYNFGHTQTMEFFQHHGASYFWIGTKGVEADDGITWSTQLARLAYRSGAVYTSNTQVQRISSIIKATTSGEAHGSGKLQRFDAAMSDNGKLLIASQSTNEDTYFSIYNNEEVNSRMDMLADDGYIPANLLCNYMTKGYNFGVIQKKAVPYNSIQGFELTNADSLYITSGSSGSTPVVGKIYSDKNFHYTYLTNGHWDNSSFKVETESVQVKGDQLYVTISYHTTGKNSHTTSNRIYKLDKRNV